MSDSSGKRPKKQQKRQQKPLVKPNKKPQPKIQPKDMIFALDIGTRSIIGIVGAVDGEKLRVIAMEKEEHTQRSMVDGQIEDIEQVAKVALIVKSRLEAKLRIKLKRVCVAAAGRALRTQRASYEMEFQQPQRLDDEIVSRLEGGAIGEAETAFTNGLDNDNHRQFYMVGHTAVQYYIDNYPISSLLDHQARHIRVDVIATYLPSEVVDSLYMVMKKINLEIVNLTLEPIAAINAVIPKKLRLLNLALVDIGAGTSDIAVCKDGGIVGYTMVTVAGDEITETLMKRYLLDFNTAETVKTTLGGQNSVSVPDILGFEQTISQDDMLACINDSMSSLCREISERICEVNGGPTSAVYLAGGGSKLASVRDGIAKYMNMDINRIAVAGNNFQTYAFSDTCNLNDPEYATPLGIAVSAGLNLITESFQITLNGSRAKLFRNNTMTVLDILMMNGFSYHDLMPRTGQKLIVQFNGKQTVFYGTPGEPAVLLLNGQEAKTTNLVLAGDAIHFTPSVHGQSAQPRLKDLLANTPDQAATVNGKAVPPDTLLKSGDVVITGASATDTTSLALQAPRKSASLPEPTVSDPSDDCFEFFLNNQSVILPKKPDGSPYYVMDMLELSGINLENPTGDIVLRVNGADGSFLHDLKDGDRLDVFFATSNTEETV